MLLKTLFAVAALLAAPAAADLNVWPAPASSTTGNSTVCLDGGFKISVAGGKAPADLVSAIARTQANLQRSQHQFLSPTHGAEFFPNGQGCKSYVKELVLNYAKGAATDPIATVATQSVDKRNANEAYTLDVSAAGVASATGASSLGLLRALTTFENLWFKLNKGAKVARRDYRQARDGEVADAANWNGGGGANPTFAPYAPYHIDDKPAFPWRAVLIDTSRHFFSVDTIKRQLDIMSLVKVG